MKGQREESHCAFRTQDISAVIDYASGRSRLDVGDAKGAGFREMLFIPSDRTVGPVDLVLDLLQSVAFSRVADEYSFRADVFQSDEELLGLGDRHVVIVFAVNDKRRRMGCRHIFEGRAPPGFIHQRALMQELAEFHFFILVVIGHVVVADQIRDTGRGNRCLELIRLGDEPFRELAAVADAFDRMVGIPCPVLAVSDVDLVFVIWIFRVLAI